jgi:hypothetical protein
MEDLRSRPKEIYFPKHEQESHQFGQQGQDQTVSPGIYIDSIGKIGKMKKNNRAKSANKYAYT